MSHHRLRGEHGAELRAMACSGHCERVYESAVCGAAGLAAVCVTYALGCYLSAIRRARTNTSRLSAH